VCSKKCHFVHPYAPSTAFDKKWRSRKESNPQPAD
jgi:hypothetical protein